MRTRCMSGLCLFVLLTAPLTAAAQDKDAKPKPEQPSLVLRLRSLESLFETLRLDALKPLAAMGAPSPEEMIKEKIGPDGFAGLDYKRPIAVYGKIDADPQNMLNSVVIVVPVSDEKKFVDSLDKLDFKAEKDGNGLWKSQMNMFGKDLHFRFAHKCAYFTLGDAETLDAKRLILPKDLFPKERTGLGSVSLRIENIPQQVKADLLAKLGELPGFSVAPNKKEGKAEKEFRELFMQEFVRYMNEALFFGKDLTLEVDIDKRTQNLSVDVTFSAQPDSDLGKTIRKLGATRSLFGGLLQKDAAFNALANFSLPEKLNAKFTALLQEGFKKALEENKENAKKFQMSKLFEALLPSVSSGELDGAVSLRGPHKGVFTLVGGVKVKETDKLMKAVIDILKDTPGEEIDLKLNAARVGDVSIHRIDAKTQLDPKLKEVFGENPIFFAFRKDAVFVAMGGDGLKAIKEALQAPTVTGSPIVFEASMGRLAQLMAKNDEQRKIAETLLEQGKNDRLRVTVEGGDFLRLRLELNLTVIEPLGRVMQQMGKEKEDEKEKENDKEKKDK